MLFQSYNMKSKNVIKLSLFLWLVTIILFALKLLDKFNQPIWAKSWSNNELLFFFGDIIIGIISFLIALITGIGLLTRTTNKNQKHEIPKPPLSTTNKKNSWTLLLSVLLVIIVILFGIRLNSSNLYKGTNEYLQKALPATITSQPTDFPTVTEKPYPATQYIAPTTDPDPPVLCPVNEKCGGETTPLRQSECANSTCCEINGKWVFYKDKSQCIKDQDSRNNQNYNPEITMVCNTSNGPRNVYGHSQSELDKNCSNMKETVDMMNAIPTTGPIQYAPTLDTSAILQNCLNTAQSVYNNSISIANGLDPGKYDLNSQCMQLKNQANSIYQAAQLNCHNQFGN